MYVGSSQCFLYNVEGVGWKSGTLIAGNSSGSSSKRDRIVFPCARSGPHYRFAHFFLSF